ncbi:MAG: hypothetical protein AAGM67_12840, partial [Bacteroidota bacterium]
VDFPSAPIPISPEEVPMTMYMNLDMGTSMVYMTSAVVIGNIDPSDEEMKEQLLATFAESMKNNSALGDLLTFREVEDITYKGVEGRQWLMGSDNWRAPEMHLRIFVKKGMVCILLAGNQTKTDQSEEINRFFNSLEFMEIPEEPWVDIRDERGAFKMSFPAKPIHNVQRIEVEGEEVEISQFQAISRKEGARYGSIVYYYDMDTYFPNDTAVVKLAMQGIAERLPNIEIIEDTIYRRGEYAFGKRKMDMNSMGMMADIEIWIRGSRIHNNTVIYTKDSNKVETQQFFDSFGFLDYQPVQWQDYEALDGDFKIEFPAGEVIFTGDTVDATTNYFNPDWTIRTQYQVMDTNSSITYSVLMDEAGEFYEIADQDSFMLWGMEDFRYEEGEECQSWERNQIHRFYFCFAAQ